MRGKCAQDVVSGAVTLRKVLLFVDAFRVFITCLMGTVLPSNGGQAYGCFDATYTGSV